MATMSSKPSMRYSVSDWATSNKHISDSAETKRNASHDIRQEGRALRNETDNKTSWNEYDSSRRLSERISDVTRWKENLKACAQEVDAEMDALTMCLSLREGRRGKELVSDPVEAELKKEVEVIDEAQRLLQQCIDQAFEQLCRLQETRQQLTSDLQDKIEALDVDMSCLNLSIQSPEISFKPNPMRVPSGSTTPQQWEQFSQFNIARAKEEMQTSVQIRENNSITRAQVQNDLEAQRMAVEFALRKRRHHEDQAFQEMQWQLKTTQNEISELEKDIVGLENDLQAKTAPLKLVHTRLENRIKRPGMDLCRDEVQFGLVDEAKQLESTILVLKQKLAQAQHSLQSLKQHEAQMMGDLSRKQEALSLEQRSSQTRLRLAQGAQSEAFLPLTNSSGRHKLNLA
ncbi:hypothetical protein DNTS_029320 [Danionella cerebrum]|uniref:Tektin n=1 Tax=Danionella cerebrum TaxID=2873325 RepID=A0A553R2I2_9TELE|nr:hypothetical protein DNTS_029320 [Danionella translucida]